MNNQRFLNSLKRDVQIFYDAIIYLLKNNKLNNIYFGNFPHGACGNASELLGVFLNKKGYNNITLVSGEFHPRLDSTHAWLVVEGYIVDITAYQFDGFDIKVFISSKSNFHKEFESIECRPFSGDIKEIAFVLHRDYKEISDYLKSIHAL